MNSRHLLVLLGLALGLVPAVSTAAKPASDLVSPEKRKAVVDQAYRLTHPAEPAPLPADFIQPFNPAGFDQPDPEELRAAAAAAAKAPQPSAGPTPPGMPPPATGDREILENIAAKILPNGTISVNGKPRLVFGRSKPFEVGTKFTVTNSANGQDYEIELIAIEPPTFTLRYHNEEITRPIKSGKSQ